MRIFKGLENIHAVIDRHDNEWRREQGEPEVPEYTPNEAARRRWAKITEKGNGGRDPKRFLEGSKKAKKEAELEEEVNEANGPEVEIVEVIKQEGTQHSWLYNEVEKAVRAAVANDKKHTKVIAIFVPVIQNAKEFEELPADENLTLPPVEEEIPQEDDTMPFEVTVEESSEETQPADEASVTEETEEAPTEVNEAPEVLEDSEPALGDVYEEPEQKEQAQEILEQEAEAEPEEHNDFNLIPEGQEHPDEELAEAFSTMEEKLAETPQAKSASEIDLEAAETEFEAEAAEESMPEITEDDTQTEEISETFEQMPDSDGPLTTEEEQPEESFRESEQDELGADTAADITEFESEAETENIDENFADSGIDEELSEEFNDAAENTAEELTVIDETPGLASEPEEELTGEAMAFEEFPTILPSDEDVGTDANLDDFIEEVTPVDETPADSDEEVGKKNLEPPSIEDFDDDEVFEEPLEMLDEDSESEYEYSEDSDNIRIE